MSKVVSELALESFIKEHCYQKFASFVCIVKFSQRNVLSLCDFQYNLLLHTVKNSLQNLKSLLVFNLISDFIMTFLKFEHAFDNMRHTKENGCELKEIEIKMKYKNKDGWLEQEQCEKISY